MQTEVKLQADFMYPWIWIALLVIFFGAMIFLIFYRKKEKPALENIVPQAIPKNYMLIREEYLKKIDYLEYQCQNKQLSMKEAYYSISSIVREFAFEMTGVKVDKYSLREIERLGMPMLTTLISECYVPEFAKDEEANPFETIYKTREVIARWDMSIR